MNFDERGNTCVISSETSEISNFNTPIVADGNTEKLINRAKGSISVVDANNFIEALKGDEGAVCDFGLFVDKGDGKPRNFKGTLQDLWDELYNANTEGYGVFIAVNNVRVGAKTRKAEDIETITAFFVDIDKESDNLPNFHLEPSLIVESSPKKYHIYWILKEPIKMDADEYKKYQKRLIARYKADGADVHVCDITRVLRVPGFLHNKKEIPVLSKIKRISNSDTPKYDVDEIFKDISKTLEEVKENLLEIALKSESTTVQDTNLTTPVKLENYDYQSEEYRKQVIDFADKKLIELSNTADGNRNDPVNKIGYLLSGLLINIDGNLHNDYYDKAEELLQSNGWSDHGKTLKQAWLDGQTKPCYLPVKQEKTGVQNLPFYDFYNFKVVSFEKKKTKIGNKEVEAKKSEFEELSKPNQHRYKIHCWLAKIGKLEWNSMSLGLELDREPICPEEFLQRFLVDCNEDIKFDAFKELIAWVGKNRRYHPIQEWLDKLPVIKPEDAERYLDVLWLALGNISELEKKQIKKWLIGAVARQYDPGCKLDTVLILQGRQGLRKTGFFETLFPTINNRATFATCGAHKNEADEIMAMKNFWCSEYGEIEATFDKKGISLLKNFITRTEDTFRAPYGKIPETFKRDFILCGTTNEEEFLADATGNRRYWVIRPTKIDLSIVGDYQSCIWSAVKALYLQGRLEKNKAGKWVYNPELWWFDSESKEAQEIDGANKEFSYSDSRLPLAIKALKEHGFLATASEIIGKMNLAGLIDNKAGQQQIGKIFQGCPCVKKSKKSTSGKQQWVYEYFEELDPDSHFYKKSAF